MSDFDIEERLRRSLQARAEGVRPEPATWAKVADGMRRARLWRWSLAGAGAVAAVALAALVVPALFERTTVDFADPRPGEIAEPGATEAVCGGPAHVTAVLARTGEGLEDTLWALCDDGSERVLDARWPDGFTDINPALSWDGTSLVFERRSDDDSHLVHIDMRTGRQRVLGGGALPAFAPDGRLAWVQRVEQGQDRIVVGRPFDEPELEFPVIDGEDGEWFDARRLAWDASGETLYAEIGYETSVVHAYDVGALYRSSRRGGPDGRRLEERTNDRRYIGPSSGPAPSSVAVVERCCAEGLGEPWKEGALRIVEQDGERFVASLPEGFDLGGAIWTAWAPAGRLRQTDDGASTWNGGSRPLYLVGDGLSVWAAEPDGTVTRILDKVTSVATNPALSADGPGAGAGAGPLAPAQDGLPDAVRITRQRIWAAAKARDFDALAAVMAEGFKSSFGADGGRDAAVARLREMEQRGEDPFGLVMRLLAVPYGVDEPEGGPAYYAWPRPFTIEAAQWTQDDLKILRSIGATEADIAGYREFGGYIGWRVGIRDDGRWEYLVRGD